jgi:hypothetical protein
VKEINVRLGKKEYKYDPRTVLMGRLLVPPPEKEAPSRYDHDKGKKVFPLDVWGNDEWGDCVFVSEANGLVRLERTESRRTISINEEVVVGKYKTMTGSQSPGDGKDQGYVILDALKDWRNNGWTVGKKTYKIAAYGELDKNDGRELRQAIWLLGGIYIGVGLPRYVSGLVRNGVKTWDVVPTETQDTQPWSWGGHAMFAKRYDKDGIYVLTWGTEVKLTNAFVARYCDEAWAVVDDLQGRSTRIDVAALTHILRGIADNIG